VTTDDDIEVEIDLSDVDPDYVEEPVDWSDVDAGVRAEFEPKRPAAVHLDPKVARSIYHDRFLTAGQLMRMPPPEWMVQGLFPLGFTVLHGDGGSYKTFLMLDWMLCADQGLDWHGRKVRQGRCLYMAGEGARGIGKRIRAWCYYHDLDPKRLNTIFMTKPVNLFADDRDAARAFLARVMKRGRFDYLVIDTLHTASGGADENSSKEIGKVFERAVEIAGDSTLFFVHHDPKAGNTPRGTSSIRDDADVVLSSKKVEGVDLTGTLRASKVRDEEEFKKFEFHLIPVHPPGAPNSLVIDSIDVNMNPMAMQHGQRIINIVGDKPGITTNGLKEALGGVNGSQLVKWMKPLIEGQQVLALEGPNRAKLWYLPGDEPDAQDA
jgi:hypothetical protein